MNNVNLKGCLAVGVCASVLFCVAVAGRAQDAAKPKTAPGSVEKTPAADRVTLWNGRDLSGWKMFLGDPKEGQAKADPAKVWTVAEGVLKFDTKASGYALTEKTYSDYHLHIGWRWPKDAVKNSNSGILIHVNGADKIWPVCFECQLASGNAGQIVGMDLDIPDAPLLQNRKRAPRLVKESSEKPFGDWNTYDIHAKNDTIEVFVNGVRQNRVEKLPERAGAIGLQLEGFPIEFKDIWLEKK